jgi:hypothetical protein
VEIFLELFLLHYGISELPFLPKEQLTQQIRAEIDKLLGVVSTRVLQGQKPIRHGELIKDYLQLTRIKIMLKDILN